MRKTRKAHLWIGLIASILILMESITGLLMNEPWLIGQSQVEGKGGFQQGQFPGAMNNGSNQSGQFQGQNQSQNSGQTQANGQTQSPSQGENGNNTPSGQFPGPGGNFGGRGLDGSSSGSFMSVIKGLHEGRIGTTDVKWLIDLAALAMIFLTGSGIYLSLKVLGADRKKKKRQADKLVAEVQ